MTARPRKAFDFSKIHGVDEDYNNLPTLKMHLGNVMDEMIVNERMARKELVKFLRESGIAHMNVLHALKSEVNQGLYVRSDQDMYPGESATE